MIRGRKACLLLMTMAFGAFATSTAFAQANKAPIEVGSVAALTGYLAGYDGEFLNGLKLAVKVANANGGADGHPLSLHIADGASNATNGVTVTNHSAVAPLVPAPT